MADFSLVLEAMAWGVLSAVSLVIGAIIGIVNLPGPRTRAAFMAFGSGALIEALSIELFAHIAHKAQSHIDDGRPGIEAVFVAIAAAIFGGLCFAILNKVLNEQGAFARKASTVKTYATHLRQQMSKKLIKKLRKTPIIFDVVSEEELESLLRVMKRETYSIGDILHSEFEQFETFDPNTIMFQTPKNQGLTPCEAGAIESAHNPTSRTFEAYCREFHKNISSASSANKPKSSESNKDINRDFLEYQHSFLPVSSSATSSSASDGAAAETNISMSAVIRKQRRNFRRMLRQLDKFYKTQSALFILSGKVRVEFMTTVTTYQEDLLNYNYRIDHHQPASSPIVKSCEEKPDLSPPNSAAPFSPPNSAAPFAHLINYFATDEDEFDSDKAAKTKKTSSDVCSTTPDSCNEKDDADIIKDQESNQKNEQANEKKSTFLLPSSSKTYVTTYLLNANKMILGGGFLVDGNKTIHIKVRAVAVSETVKLLRIPGIVVERLLIEQRKEQIKQQRGSLTDDCDDTGLKSYVDRKLHEVAESVGLEATQKHVTESPSHQKRSSYRKHSNLRTENLLSEYVPPPSTLAAIRLESIGLSLPNNKNQYQARYKPESNTNSNLLHNPLLPALHRNDYTSSSSNSSDSSGVSVSVTDSSSDNGKVENDQNNNSPLVPNKTPKITKRNSETFFQKKRKHVRRRSRRKRNRQSFMPHIPENMALDVAVDMSNDRRPSASSFARNAYAVSPSSDGILVNGIAASTPKSQESNVENSNQQNHRYQHAYNYGFGVYPILRGVFYHLSDDVRTGLLDSNKPATSIDKHVETTTSDSNNGDDDNLQPFLPLLKSSHRNRTNTMMMDSPAPQNIFTRAIALLKKNQNDEDPEDDSGDVVDQDLESGREMNASAAAEAAKNESEQRLHEAIFGVGDYYCKEEEEHGDVAVSHLNFHDFVLYNDNKKHNQQHTDEQISCSSASDGDNEDYDDDDVLSDIVGTEIVTRLHSTAVPVESVVLDEFQSNQTLNKRPISGNTIPKQVQIIDSQEDENGKNKGVFLYENEAVSAKSKHAAIMVWLGILIDGIPESLVLGILASTSSMGSLITFVIGVFLSNLPEAMSSSGILRAYGMRKRIILLMWTSIVIMTGLGAGLGALLFPPGSETEYTSAMCMSFIEGMSGGAMLTMLSNTALPEAFEQGGNVVGMSTLLGFLTALAVSVIA